MAPMRLHLTIRRHNLPATQILFTYPSPLPGSHTAALLPQTATISHLLRDITTVIPLESEDTNWGLEDYSIEVHGYEALHYQCVDDVLRDGDEVVIRALRIEDLRARRLGGRLQIDEGGRHLVDGVAWGRQMLKSVQRPDFSLPPRKKRRIEEQEREQLIISNGEEHHGDADEDAEATSVVHSEQPLRITAGQDFENADEEDSEEDNDFESGSDDEDVSEEGVDSDELDDLQEESEVAEDDLEPISEDMPQSDGSILSASERKRKRSIVEDGGEEDGATDFNGFSSPVKKPRANSNDVTSKSESDSGVNLDSSSSSEAESESESESEGDDPPTPLRIETRLAARNQVDSDETSSSGSDSEEPSSGSSSSYDEEEADSSSESSSDTSEASHKALIPPKAAPTKSSQSRSALQVMDTNVRITNAREGEINQTNTVPGEGLQRTRYNNNRSNQRKRLKNLKESGLLPPKANFAILAAYEKSQEAQQVGDSEELAELVAAKKKTLSELAEGGDDTSVIQACGSIANGTPAKHLQSESPGQVPSVTKSEPVRTPSNHLFSRDPAAEVPGTSHSEVKPEPVKQRARLDLNAARNMLFSSLGVRKPKNAEQEQALREKFDRPVKGAYPRTLTNKTEDCREGEATLTDKVNLEKGENDWRSKIKLSAVECEPEGVELSEPPFPFYQGWDAAANKRFTNKKKKLRNQKQYYQNDGSYDQRYDESYENEGDDIDWQEPDHEEETYAREAARSQDEKVDQANGIHVDAEHEEVLKALDLPRPANIDSLESLQKEAITPGTVLAYKQLHINNCQPEVSPYRVARIEAVHDDGSFELSLSSQDRTPAKKAIFNDETGERILSRSEMMQAAGDEEEDDDGSRLMTMDDLIEPKIVEKPARSQLGSEIMASVLVNASTEKSAEQLPSAQAEAVIPESIPTNMIATTDTTTSGAVLPDSADLGMVAATNTTVALRCGEINTEGVVNVTTPRRKEITNIMKDAAFNSALDFELMQPIDGAEEDDWQPNNGFDDEEALQYDGALNEEGASSPQADITRLDDRSSSKAMFEESALSKAVDADTSGLESPRFNGWTSSPHIEPELQETSSQVAHEDDWLTTQEDPIEADDNVDEESVTLAKVTYPHISQLEIESATLESSPILNVAQVHHQGDAAEASADDAAIPHHDNNQGQNNQAAEIEETKMESMKSAVLPSIDSIEEQPLPKTKLTDVKDSFLGGLDGNDSSRQEDELPSLEHITSKARSQSTKITPPPLRKLRNATAVRRRRSGSGESTDFPSQQVFKQSQSQMPLSQIPEGAQVVDLTFSSDPVSPGNSDGDYARTRRMTRRSTTAERQSKGMETRSETSKALASSLGLGNRRLLKSKKKS